jgi:hypothetical protein
MMKRAIHDVVWNHETHQITTHKVAERFGCSLRTARKILMAIVTGTSGDEWFKLNTERGEGVMISNGKTFNYSPMDMDGNGSSPRTPKHYVWFCS